MRISVSAWSAGGARALHASGMERARVNTLRAVCAAREAGRVIRGGGAPAAWHARTSSSSRETSSFSPLNLDISRKSSSLKSILSDAPFSPVPPRCPVQRPRHAARELSVHDVRNGKFAGGPRTRVRSKMAQQSPSRRRGDAESESEPQAQRANARHAGSCSGHCWRSKHRPAAPTCLVGERVLLFLVQLTSRKVSLV